MGIDIECCNASLFGCHANTGSSLGGGWRTEHSWGDAAGGAGIEIIGFLYNSVPKRCFCFLRLCCLLFGCCVGEKARNFRIRLYGYLEEKRGGFSGGNTGGWGETKSWAGGVYFALVVTSVFFCFPLLVELLIVRFSSLYFVFS
jgi:hypothetical protein